MDIRKLDRNDERWLRQWIVSLGDPALGMHRQLRDYFLAPTEQFGVSAVMSESTKAVAAIFWSTTDTKSFVHNFIGDMEKLPMLITWLGEKPIQMFVRENQLHQFGRDGWEQTLSVYPGYVIPHPAYDGVFSRVAPRYHGSVFERP